MTNATKGIIVKLNKDLKLDDDNYAIWQLWYPKNLASERHFESVLRKDYSEEVFGKHDLNPYKTFARVFQKNNFLELRNHPSEDLLGKDTCHSSSAARVTLPLKLEPYKNLATGHNRGPDIGVRTIPFLQKYSLFFPSVTIFSSLYWFKHRKVLAGGNPTSLLIFRLSSIVPSEASHHFLRKTSLCISRSEDFALKRSLVQKDSSEGTFRRPSNDSIPTA